MNSQPRSQSILVVKTESLSSGERLELDRLCHGLLSWVRSRGVHSEDWTLVIPEYGAVERLYLWPQSGEFPWKKLPDEVRTCKVLWWGNFSKDELREAQKKFPDLQHWEPRLIGDLGAS